jgi:hypothetical protein
MYKVLKISDSTTTDVPTELINDVQYRHRAVTEFLTAEKESETPTNTLAIFMEVLH